MVWEKPHEVNVLKIGKIWEKWLQDSRQSSELLQEEIGRPAISQAVAYAERALQRGRFWSLLHSELWNEGFNFKFKLIWQEDISVRERNGISSYAQHSRFSIHTQSKIITRRSRVCSCRSMAGGPLRHDTGWRELCTSVRYTRWLLPHPVPDNGGKDWPPPLGRNHKVWNVSASPWQEVMMKSDNLCYRVPPVTWLGSRWIK